MFERLAKNKREFEEQTKVHINEYADAGLRTLILAYRELDEEEYNEFNATFTEAKNSVSADRDQRVEQVTEKIEKDLILLGATAVEDKLQNGVPECRDKLAQAGIKIMRRIEAEELSLGASEIVITSTRQEIEQQWRLYDGFDPILERKLQAKIKRNVSCYGRFMPRMALIPPGMEFIILFHKMVTWMLKQKEMKTTHLLQIHLSGLRYAISFTRTLHSASLSSSLGCMHSSQANPYATIGFYHFIMSLKIQTDLPPSLWISRQPFYFLQACGFQLILLMCSRCGWHICQTKQIII